MPYLTGVALHVSVGVLVGVDEHEPEAIELDQRADVQVTCHVVLAQARTELLLTRLADATAFEELAADDA